MKKYFYLLLSIVLLTPTLTWAQTAGDDATTEPPAPVTLVNPLGDGVQSIPELVGRIIIGIMGIVGAIALLTFIWGGLLWMTSAGNADRVKQGKETLIYSTLGLLVIFISYSVINFVFQALAR